MKAAVVRAPRQMPVYFPEPAPSAGENRIKVSAAATNHIAKTCATKRVRSMLPKVLPHTGWTGG